ncbi:MAG TPA: lipid II flippase MurJ [Candidatus Paceibacterota bacterium]|nr:lipid II flippase MurJ [Candidatus Paceibacterota bacterium]
MIGPLKFLSRETRGMHQAAYVLAAFSFLSQLTGVLRDRILAASFGAGHTLDLYYAAFRLPDFLFATFASLFSLYALLPVLSRFEAEQEGMMIAFLRGVMLVFFAGMTVIAMIAYILTPALAPLLAPGLAGGASGAELVLLIRILLLQPILLGASNTIASLTQLRHRFVLYSVSPLLYNFGIIFGALVMYPLWGLPGLVSGVVLGALLHMLVQLPYFLAEKTNARMPLTKLLQGVKDVLMLSVPRTLALASTQISLAALTAIASLLTAGSIAIFTFAYNLQSVPLTIIGISYSVAAFPTLARLHAQGARKDFLNYVEAALRHIIFWSIPATVFLIVMRAQVVRVILGAGRFDWTDTRLTAAALALFVLSLTVQSLTLVIARAYYASGDTKKPFYYGCTDVLVSIGSGIALLWFFHSNLFFRDFCESLLRVDDVPGTAVLMLAFGYTLGSTIEFIVSYLFFMRDFAVSHLGLVRLSFESFCASVIGAATTYGILSISHWNIQIDTTLALIVQSTIAGSVGLAVTAMMLLILKNREFSEAIISIRKRLTDQPRAVVVEPHDISS